MDNTTTISLSEETRDLLKGYGRKGETYDEIIRRLLKIAEQIEFAQEQKRILGKEEFAPFERV
ncbi:MAG: hypothetical protein R6V83_13825 [Candidatus Thorarchaeota archaeon]